VLKIGVDIDGVLSNFTSAARNVCKALFNGNPPDGMIQTGWGFDSLGITKDEENQMWRKIDSVSNWWLTHSKLPNTDLLLPLCNKHRVIFITNRKDGTGLPVDKQSAIWLTEQFGLLCPPVLLSDDKGPIINSLKLDYYIDDRPKNVSEAVLHAPRCRTALLDATYNQDFQFAWRVKSFNDFAKPLLEVA
jgi:5'(3')-deoxyribonucleotidase